ncbi:MAG: cation-transporting P-type ATPase, partial [Acetobacteraceae bacterium]
MTDRPEAGAAGPAAAWHAMPAADALAALRSTRAGLISAGAEARLATPGPHRLPEPPRRPDWRRFLDQFANLL